MRSLAVLLALFAACCSSRPSSTAPASADPMAQARAHELGDGVARDYAAAAAIYQAQCASGAGQRTACRRWLRAMSVGRGADLDLQRIAQLARAMCAHREGLGCYFLAALGTEP